jgi:hypothetical protein
MQRLWLLLLPLILAGCTAEVGATINPNEVYRGYPCLNYCHEFQAGYQAAEQRQFSKAAQCTQAVLEEKTGCLAFINEQSRITPTFTDLKIK